jgi:hypothetical protein
MKKIFFLLVLICLSGLSFMKAASVIVPTVGTEYTIVHHTGLYLGRTVADNPKIVAASGLYNQVFLFEPVAGEEGSYYIQNLDKDEYLVRANVPKTDGTGQDTWTMIWVSNLDAATTPEDTKFQITANGDYVYIKNLGSGAGNLGVDSTDPNSSVYGNKGTGNNSSWTIKEYTTEVDKVALIAKLADANLVYANTEEGNNPDQYPSATRTALKSAIDAAQAVVDNATAWQTEVTVALEDLVAALDAYVNSVRPLRPSATTTWRIQHSSGLVFSNSIKILVATYTPDQEYEFVATSDPDIFNIKSVSTGSFLTRSDNGWDLTWGEDANSDLAQFILKKVAASSGYYTVRVIGLSGGKTEEWSFVGTDSNEPNASGSYPTIYADKSGKDGKHYWTFVDAKNGPVIKTALQEIIAKVNEFLTDAVKGDGSDQYPATEYDALTAALTTANTVLNDANATQATVGTTTLTLNDALVAAIAAVHPFIPSTQITYNIIHYGGLFLGEYSDDTHTNTVAVLGQTRANDQLFSLLPVSGKTGVINVKIASLPDRYLTRSNVLTGTNSSGVDQYDDYRLVWGDDPTTEFAQFEIKKSGTKDYYTVKCITSGSQRPTSYLGADDSAPARKDGAYIDKDGKSTAHLWKVIDSTTAAIQTIAANKLNIYSADHQLKITDLKGNNRVSIYTTTGQLVFRTDISGSSFSKGLPIGNYIAVVEGPTSYRGIVAVR